MDGVFKALSDPTRRKILHLLNSGDKTAGELSAAFPITDASMSHHFTVLKAAGLVDAERKGQQIVYRLNTTVVQDLMTSLLDMFHKKEADGETS